MVASARTTIRCIISTVSIGCFPTAVSPESITASVPSQTAFATSDASARVGSGSSIIDSSIWVAVMTGMPRRFALRMIVFWIGGTSSVAISTPRSPRATITPSLAARISSRWSIACGFSSLAISGTGLPCRVMNARARCQVRGRPHEAERHQVHALRQPEGQVLLVLLAQRRRRDGDPGQVDPLVLLQHAAVDHLERDLGRLGVGDDQLDPAVVHQHGVADAAVRWAGRVGGRDALGGALDLRSS